MLLAVPLCMGATGIPEVISTPAPVFHFRPLRRVRTVLLQEDVSNLPVLTTVEDRVVGTLQKPVAGPSMLVDKLAALDALLADEAVATRAQRLA